jgi:hypothetical protein
MEVSSWRDRWVAGRLPDHEREMIDSKDQDYRATCLMKTSFHSQPEQGYFPVDRRETSTAENDYKHQLCGPTTTGGAICPNCDKALLTLARLDARDPRLEVEGTGLFVIPLLFCWTCELSQDELVYEVIDQGHAIHLLSWRSGAKFSDFPYTNYPRSFPTLPAGLKPVDPSSQAVLSALNRNERPWALASEYPELSRPQHQIGGEPLLMQVLEPRPCAKCREAMPLFVSIWDKATDNARFTGNDFAQVLFHVCRRCLVVNAYQVTD